MGGSGMHGRDRVNSRVLRRREERCAHVNYSVITNTDRARRFQRNCVNNVAPIRRPKVTTARDALIPRSVVVPCTVVAVVASQGCNTERLIIIITRLRDELKTVSDPHGYPRRGTLLFLLTRVHAGGDSPQLSKHATPPSVDIKPFCDVTAKT